VFALIVQGLVPGTPECIYAFAGTVLFVNLCLADLVRRALDLPFRRRIYFTTAAMCTVVSFVPLALGARFWMIALLPSIPVSLPLFGVPREALRSPRPLSPGGRLVIGAVVASPLHALASPFLRTAACFIPYGAPTPIIPIFALSISAPAII